MTRVLIYIILPALLALPVWAQTVPTQTAALPSVTGELGRTRVAPGESLIELAYREKVGFDMLANSNRQHDPWTPSTGTEIILPRRAILPFGAQRGIVINMAELRLYHIYDRAGEPEIVLYPLGIGREGRETPEGTYRIVMKKEQPDWRVPAGLRESDPSLPAIVPPGPRNPLGAFWLGLSAPGYGIHGTNRPYGVGRRVSYGCLRMYPEDIAFLYAQVATDTPVIITYQPIKAAWLNEDLLLEVHPDYLHRLADPFQQALTVISRTGWPGEIDYARVRQVVETAGSLPEIVGRWHQSP